MLREGETYPIDAFDPWEGMNRRIFRFNYYFDKYVFLPVASAYEFITPDFVETGPVRMEPSHRKSPGHLPLR
ncbi:MAG: VacJ family lipoprotein, partial [Desulfobacteraceae bacterium]|nr:VacJ family lipoprotein [Desulfobacteraceae bacterium]